MGANSNNPYRASMATQKNMPMAPQKTAYLPVPGDRFLNPFEQPPLPPLPPPPPPPPPPPVYKPHGSSSVLSSRMMSMAPIPETTTTTRTTRTTSTSHPGASVPSLDLSDQSYEDDPSPSTPSNDDDDVSDDGYSETFGSRGDAPDTPVPRKGDMWSVPEPPQYTSKRVLRKIKRLVKRRTKNIETITVFNSDDDIICHYEAPGAAGEKKQRYIPTSDEGKYLRLALELGFKSEGCGFGFGNVAWLSGRQEEVDEKRTLLGSTANDSQAGGNHQFYGVLSPTGRYVMAAILKESPASGTVSPGVMRKIRDLADKMEVYESRAGAGGLLVKIEALLKNGN